MNADANIDSICLIRDNDKFKIFLYNESRIEFVGGNITYKAILKMLSNIKNICPESQEVQEKPIRKKNVSKNID